MADVQDLARYFILLDSQNEGDGISNLKLQKLVYYAQGFFCALYNAPIFENNIEAWTHGPVVPELYHHYKSHGSNPVPLNPQFDIQALNENEIELAVEIFEVFGQYSAWRLRDMTHEEPPWINHKDIAGIIPQEELAEYFKTRLN
ncbi:hypothetical protein MNBD_GAMMA08-928 [hydrothermal vent metagenome]|uniref:Antitoxin SocA-like Panacea domain-containing protein n=1 Tax=hydrothermal vent metagenome TaxID=652676 RepID=A0A3B0XTY8_9ZZZZ